MGGKKPMGCFSYVRVHVIYLITVASFKSPNLKCNWLYNFSSSPILVKISTIWFAAVDSGFITSHQPSYFKSIYYRFKSYPVLSVLILKVNQFHSEIMFQQAADSTQAVAVRLLHEEGECTVWHMRSLYIDNYRILPLILAVWLCGFQCQSVSPTLWSRLIYLKNYEMYCYLSFIQRRNPTEFGNHLIFYVVAHTACSAVDAFWFYVKYFNNYLIDFCETYYTWWTSQEDEL